ITVLSFSITPRPPTAPLFPYTTLFRSRCWPPASTSTALSPRSRVADGALLPRHLRAERDDGRRGGGRRHPGRRAAGRPPAGLRLDRKSTRLNSSHQIISYAVFCLKKKT